MYHIKDDKRSRTSARLICEGLMRCLERNEFSQITITDVQKESCVGRATFYRLFDRLPDVLAYQCDNIFDELFDNEKVLSKKTVPESFVAFVEYWMRHYILLETIVESSHIEILHESHKKNAERIKEFLFPHTDIGTLQMEYIIAMLTSMMTGVLTIWARNDRKETAPELFGIIRNSFLIFYKYLIKDI